MFRWQALLLSVVAVTLSGCRIVENAVEQETAPPVVPAPAPAVEPTPPPPEPEPAAEAEPPPDDEPTTVEQPAEDEEPVEELTGETEATEPPAEEPAEAASADGEPEAEAVPADGPAEAPVEAEEPTEAPAEPEPEPVDSAGLAARVIGAARSAVKTATTRGAAELERRRLEEQAELARRRATDYVAAGRDHLRYLSSFVAKKNVEQAGLQSALLGLSLEGVRRNLQPSPAADELAYALAELHRLGSGDAAAVTAAVDKAMTRLTAALAMLPNPAPPADQPDALADDAADSLGTATEAGPAESEAVLAREVTAIVTLLERKQNATARQRLTDLVLEVCRPPAADALAYAEASREAVDQAVRRRAWSTASRAVERLGTELEALSAALGGAPSDDLGTAAAESDTP